MKPSSLALVTISLFFRDVPVKIYDGELCWEHRFIQIIGGEAFKAIFRDMDCLFKLRGKGTVIRNGRPPILKDMKLFLAKIYHGFNGEDHTGDKDNTFPFNTVMRYLG